MLAAILICGTMTMLTSCSENDNPVVPPIEPEEPEEYVIEVGEGMTMHENKFLTVPATTDCDQDIVNVLKAIDKVTDVKAFKLNTRYDYYNEEMVSKTAYICGTSQRRPNSSSGSTAWVSIWVNNTGMVVNSSSKMTIGDNTTEVQNQKNYSFVWEEVK